MVFRRFARWPFPAQWPTMKILVAEQLLMGTSLLTHRLALLLAWLLVSPCAIASNTAQADRTDKRNADINTIIAEDMLRPRPQHGVLFVGSSSLRMWKTLAADFPGVPVIGHRFSGSRLADSTRNAGRLVTPYHPKLVVLYAGDNDIAEDRTPAQVLADFAGFVTRVRADLPGVPVIYISIKPSVARAALWPRMHEANDAIARWALTQRDIVAVDIATNMLDAGGNPLPELFLPDGLHMKAAGYAIWIQARKPVFARYGFGPAARRRMS